MWQIIWHIPILKNWFPEGIPIYGFGMMLFLAFLITTWMATRLARREGIAKELMQDLVIWLFVGGLIGARVLFLLQEDRPESVMDFFKKLPRIWEGGIILYGSIIGALVGYVLAYYLVFRRFRLSTLKVADVVAPCVAVGICLGRLGCFLNGCCYGQVACPDCAVYPVHFPFSAPARESLVTDGYQTAAGFIYADHPQADNGARVGKVVPGSAAAAAGLRDGDIIVGVNDQEVDGPGALSAYLADLNKWRGKTRLELTVRHADGKTERLSYEPRTLGLYPAQLYEVISMFLLLLVLMAYYPLRRHDGQVMAVLMVGYGIHRFLNELLREDPRPVGFERYTSIILVAAGVGLWLWLWRLPAQYHPGEARREQAGKAEVPAGVAAATPS